MSSISKLSIIASLSSGSSTVPSDAQIANWTIPVSFGRGIISWFPPGAVI